MQRHIPLLLLFSVVVDCYVVNLHTPSWHNLPSRLSRSLHGRHDNVSDQITLKSSKIHIFTDCDDATIQEVSAFLIDAYWLSTPRLWTDPTADTSCDIPATESILREDAANYLSSQYGERMGQRLLKTCIIAAESPLCDSANSEIAGLLCMHELVWNNNNILPDEESETILRNAVASLGPKDRRSYKDASTIDIASKLLSSSAKAVCVISNLAVSQSFRRRGIAVDLCQAAEEMAREWGYDFLHLKVEAGNIAAANLYQNKLGYTLSKHLDTDAAIRLDLSAATFVDTEVETLILSKNIM
jgi:ribosomal protein S18 acetylase RimI-like enzyme